MDFYALYTSVGLWNAVYVIMYAITNATKLMKYSTRSTEEIFALFICIAFTVDAFKDAYSDFRKNYLTEECAQFDALVSANVSSISSGNELRLSDTDTKPLVTCANIRRGDPDMQTRELSALPAADAGHPLAGHHSLQLQPDSLPAGAQSAPTLESHCV